MWPSSAGASRWQRNHYNKMMMTAFAGSLLLLLSLDTASAAGKLTNSSFVVRLKATTPTIKNSAYKTFFAKLESSLLPSGTSGMFWGTIPEASVVSVCNYVKDTGRYTIPSASISAYGQNNMPASLTVNAITGCDGAGPNSAAGVEAVLTETRDNRRLVVICYPEFTSKLGCAVYLTGSDITNIVKKFKTSGGGQATCKDNRADCTAWGPSKCNEPVVTQTCPCMCGGTAGNKINGDVEFMSTGDAVACGAGTGGAVAAGAYTGATLCTILGPFAPLCWAGVVAGTALVSVGSCSGAIQSSSCFPAHARVLLRDGSIARMDQLQLGQEVAVRKADGTVGYEPIYAWGHKERNSGPVRYVQIDLSSDSASSAAYDAAAPETAQLELSPGHFVVMPCQRCLTSGAVAHKRANDVVPGDELWVAPALVGGNNNRSHGDGMRLELWRVKAVRYITAEGLYNPFTLGGTVMVEGVAASCHSDWFLDSAVDMLGVDAGILPPIYQSAMSPFRMLWRVFGKERYIQTYEQLDATYNITSITSLKATPPGTGGFASASGALQTALSTARLMVAGTASLAASSWDVGVATSSVGSKV
ncbi:hypothetical protein Vafri_5999 [Volvox africanus]|nr:hypothetical protein Vafri_5999 [Volvox africanus]